ncbi:hypothetical protein [Bradyrhizobium sp. CCBAU 53338]|uniref:hypothetical protein n=1 Tax=Bradyrhizobium sp. CCBAU 53338 TaxID=1325111 RepID=UPI00188D3F26|nr:hypothetical protein [Bradyrhizobium sp. CCBAU 53338]
MTGVETTKLTPSLTRKEKMERSAQLLLGPVKPSGPTIYDISRAGMQPGELENRQLWLNGDRMAERGGAMSIKVTFGAEFAFSRWSAIILR